ncbi:sigma-70 family RNA polymerase sigma factor [Planctomycetales bacterium ZRK34]|nr:sigma-70 family RNA polymerase sigma factor [Planctomycetales bacterium ZRK34]
MSTQDQLEQFVADLTGCQDSLFAFILSQLPQPHQARDVLQETNLVLWRKREEFEPGTNFQAWAMSIAQFQVRAAWRDMRRESGRLMFDDAMLGVISASVGERMDSFAQYRDALRSCISKLSDDQREIIRKRYESGGSVQSIAQTLGRSANAVSITLHRVRKVLSDCVRRTMKGPAAS